ncbi:MAG: hypothetical protein KDC10_12500, partial [Calditrichaeota bacterium]|nr:hypothetical protein [Calditrichota bacterium]
TGHFPADSLLAAQTLAGKPGATPAQFLNLHSAIPGNLCQLLASSYFGAFPAAGAFSVSPSCLRFLP